MSLKEKLRELRSEATQEQWNDPEYISTLAKEKEDSDMPLAYRLWQRAHNLTPENEAIGDHMVELARKLEQSDPDMMHVQSTRSQHTAALGHDEDTLESQKVTRLIDRFGSFQLIVLLPWVVFALYLVMWASPRYESESLLIVKQPDSMSISDPSALLLSGVGLSSGDNDTQLVSAYIKSYDMLSYLDDNLALRQHYENSEHADFFSRLSGWSSREDFFEYYLNKIDVVIDPTSMVISLKTQAFTANYAQQLNGAIIERAEWFINNVNQELANAQVEFINKEHKRAEDTLADAKKTLLQFQERYNLLDPTTEGAALQQIAFNLEAMLSQKRATLSSLTQVMSSNAPEVLAVKREIQALETQLSEEKRRLTPTNSTDETTSIAGIMAKFSELRVQLEIATQAYTASLVNLEKNRIEAMRQLQYLVTVQRPALAEEANYPRVVYNLSLWAVVLLMFYAIGRIIAATIRELS
ncbi:hypothetical protein [Aestuariibacter salexigens]|uniref:hypothetical protein n=1 Tax=Aestuariibacter salexigens TaxID=226010 RepID=UPI0004218C70|nr:hypothetical protein [Aestuariibacter salexigens]